MDADGHVTNETLSTSAGVSAISTARAYEATTGRLTSISSGNSTGQNIQTMAYGYDTIGNLTLRQDSYTLPSAGTINEAFGYDSMNRLTSMNQTGTTNANKTYAYTEIGNILSKSDIGTYTYPPSGANSVRPHAVTSILGAAGGVTNPTYNYDANGNVRNPISGSRMVTYKSFNMPFQLTQASTTTFTYDADHNRIKESYVNGQIYFVNPGNQPLFEKHANYNQTMNLNHYRHFIGGVAIFTQYSTGGSDTKYSLKDHLGSTTAVISSSGVVLKRYSYDPWGRARTIVGADPTPPFARVPTGRRGFTGHETLAENGGLIHMNGRVFDPDIGRFMTADPTVQFAGYSQSHNRYSYLLNNPLGGTDPTGYGLGEWGEAMFQSGSNPFNIEKSYYAFSKRPGGHDMDKFMMNNSWARAISNVAASYIPYAGWAVSAYLSGYEVYLQGGTHADIERTWVVSVGSAGAMYGVGSATNVVGYGYGEGVAIAFNVAGHAAVGCAAAAAGGGNCGQGALAAGFGAAATGALNTGNGKVDFVIAVVAGGIGAELGGGKFENGALSAAFQYLYSYHTSRESSTDNVPTVTVAPVESEVVIGQTLLLARPPLLPRIMRPIDELPAGSSGGRGAGKRFNPSNEDYPEGTPCTYCGDPTTNAPGPKQLNRDHVIPRSQGGNNSPENRVPSCRDCNLQKGPRTPRQWYRNEQWTWNNLCSRYA